MKRTTDLTTGRPTRIIINFSLPLLLSTALQQFYNIADSIIVGRFTGSEGLAAIGSAYPITLFYVAIATGASMGCSVIISQLFGAGKRRELKSSITTVLVCLLALGAVLAFGGALLAKPLMLLLNATGSTLTGSSAYLAIYSVGVLPMLIYNATSSVFTGLGNSKLPLLFLFISSVLNVILDYIAVAILHWGVVGAAWATTVSQFVSAVISVCVLRSQVLSTFKGEKSPLFDKGIFKSMCGIALPCIFQQACVALAHTIVQSIVNSFFTGVIAGYEAASKIHNFAYMSFNTLGTALSSYTAQNYGARKYKRIVEGFRSSTLMCLALTLFVIALMQLIPRQLLSIFVDASANEEMIKTGVHFFRIISPVYLPICLIITAGGYMRGVGRARTFFIVTVIDFTVRVTMCFVLTRALASYTGLYWAWYFGSSVDFAMCVAVLVRMIRKHKNMPDGAEPQV